ncbi:MAG TPA: hypothetical protein VFV19_06850 [Candidatus Polarisedimenticolaceae bacterium]|nr:hypothetical protein [Candidatus Polarisedimenticolaceae bacterium]
MRRRVWIFVCVAVLASRHALSTPPGQWLYRSLVGAIVAVNDDGTLSVQVAEEKIELKSVYGRGVVGTGLATPLGTRTYRLAGTDAGPELTLTRLQSLREWLVGMEVRIEIGQPFSANDAPEPVPAVILKKRDDAELNELFVRRGFGNVKVDVPEAIGPNEWTKIVVAAQTRK